ncbi:MAG TPA: peptide ABC transporter substrate-binding protein [Candidatus Dormibacteraeota bacterium]|nr:peptide ABC transporter substrate-binding protein [Candidatus Dormibacteraeota bacterium]
MEQLAADQTLSFPVASEISDFDPAQITSPADVDILRNVFSGLYGFDEHLHLVPDIATSFPDISTDGLTYTFHLRRDAHFSNGDPITVDDVIYSWNRAAAKQGDFAALFSPIRGYELVAQGRSGRLAGLTKTDAYTLVVTLSSAAGYWLTEVGLWPYWLVDQKVVSSAGDDVWFTQPGTLIGSGPFKLTAHAPGQSLDFAPVPHWYGGSTGALKRVHVEIVPDAATQVSRYESGVFSLIGYGRQSLTSVTAARYQSDATLREQLMVVPAGVTFWVGFNMTTGPFAGDAGKAGRHAFATAIDRNALADAVCSAGTTCMAATGGVLSKGLAGYLGDGADLNAKFDATAARNEYKTWDPTGAKVKNLAYTYDTNPFNLAVCQNLVNQWQKNLGVAVACSEVDRQTFFDQRNQRCAYTMFRQSWSADYNNPQDWFDYLFVSHAPSGGECYSNPNLDALIANGDSKPVGLAISYYEAAGQVLISDVVDAALVYGVQQYLVHPYVRGVGGTALYDLYWTQARILAH